MITVITAVARASHNGCVIRETSADVIGSRSRRVAREPEVFGVPGRRLIYWFESFPMGDAKRRRAARASPQGVGSWSEWVAGQRLTEGAFR